MQFFLFLLVYSGGPRRIGKDHPNNPCSKKWSPVISYKQRNLGSSQQYLVPSQIAPHEDEVESEIGQAL